MEKFPSVLVSFSPFLFLSRDRHADEESWLGYVMVFIASIQRQLCIPTSLSGQARTCLRVPIAPGDSIIANGISREYPSHLLTKQRRIKPMCNLHAKVNLV